MTHCTAPLNSAASQVQKLRLAVQVFVDSSFHARINSDDSQFLLA